MTKLQYALQFLKMGIGIIPLYHRNKKPDASLIGGTWEQYTTQNNTEYELVSWLASGWLNYGVVAGWNNLVIIDFDSLQLFDLWQMHMCNIGMHGIVDRAFKVLTSHGIHVYVRTIAMANNSKRISASGGIDVQAHRKFVVGPGCTHPNGTQYMGVGRMIFPVVPNIESVLPLDLFPVVVAKNTSEPFTGVPVEVQPTHTEYDPFQIAMFGDYLDLISRVKQYIRIESMFPNAIKSSPDGRWLKDWCSFHNDNRPGGTMSFWIDTRQQICGCQRCGMRPMDVINVYARMHNVSDSAAVSALAQKIGVWG